MLILLIRTLLVYLVIILLMRLMGKRQLGELQPSELVSTILISNLASISIESPEIPLTASLAPVFLIVALELLLSALCFQHPHAAHIFSGRPIAVIRDGIIDQNALSILRFSIADLMEGLRDKDIFDPAEVSYALMETNGRLNVCRRSSEMCGHCAKPPVPFVMDGIVISENLLWCGKDRLWLNQVLKEHHCALNEVLLLLGSDTTWYRLTKKENR